MQSINSDSVTCSSTLRSRMPPQVKPEESETLDGECGRAFNEEPMEPYTWSQIAERIIWRYLFFVALLHIGCVAAVFIYLFELHSVPVKWQTTIWVFAVTYAAGMGTTAGAHRLWTHRTYKAKLPLRILLMVLYTTIGANPLYYWIRDHRVHHKYSETDADPHNAKRGFLFSHVGWTFMKRHPDCIRRGKEVDMSDIEADPVVMFQKRFSAPLWILLCFVVPTAIPILFWNESILHAVLTQCFIRYAVTLNCMLTVNSVAHLWGNRPYNRSIKAADNPIISFLTFGEGSHNYHHTFPWDYKTSELPYMNFNCSTFFIDAMAKLGFAYDLRQPSPEHIENVVRRNVSKLGNK